MPFDGSGDSLLIRFDRAVALISDERNWCKCQPYQYSRTGDAASMYCIYGALVVVNATDAIPFVAACLPRRWGIFKRAQNLAEIIAFNDARGTRHRDVMRVMAKAHRKIIEHVALNLIFS